MPQKQQTDPVACAYGRTVAACAVWRCNSLCAAGYMRPVVLNQNTPTENRAVIRITVTGGDGGRELVPTAPGASNWLMQATPRRPHRPM